ncbi:MAG: winged helix DNA-binding domain-containing protein [Actinomycetota bacterium]|nr:winged helix DNA-binding domain-containing protein [Actinomycetota bacterium]
MRATRDAVRAARVSAQHLGVRLLAGQEAAAAASGLRDTPSRSARDALAARVQAPVSQAGLMAVWGPRGAPYVVAAADLAVFTRGALPVDEASARAFAPSAAKALAPTQIALLDAFADVERVMRAAVADGPVERDDMHQRLREALPGALLWACKGCGTRHVHPMIWRGACAMGAIRRDDASRSRAVTYAAVAEAPDPSRDAVARAELIRRVLHHHGPLTLSELAAWLSVTKPDARARLDAIAGELDELDREGAPAWALAADSELLAAPPAPRGVRLLGAADPLLDGRDRASLVPDPALQREIWKALAGPGVVLADGQVVGTWRAKMIGRRLQVTPSALGAARLPAAARLLPEAEALAAARGLTDATLA